MLFDIIRNGLTAETLIQLLFFFLTFFITITVHECAHGYIAYKMGDPTAKLMGRLTLNPVKHLDPIGFIMILLIGFGWAKPVMINPRNFRNPKKGMALSALAGPAANILMAILGSLLFAILRRVFSAAGINNAVAASALSFLYYFEMLNVWFAVFNLLPIPPLDGSRLVSYFLPPRLHYYYNYVERYGFLILILLLNIGRISAYIPIFRYLDVLSGLQFIAGAIQSGIDFAVKSIFRLFGG